MSVICYPTHDHRLAAKVVGCPAQYAEQFFSPICVQKRFSILGGEHGMQINFGQRLRHEFLPTMVYL
jgi:hypothetical protein